VDPFVVETSAAAEIHGRINVVRSKANRARANAATLRKEASELEDEAKRLDHIASQYDQILSAAYPDGVAIVPEPPRWGSSAKR
jgi:uncharacterized phage infection (PIP) family protein YhgE